MSPHNLLRLADAEAALGRLAAQGACCRIRTFWFALPPERGRCRPAHRGDASVALQCFRLRLVARPVPRQSTCPGHRRRRSGRAPTPARGPRDPHRDERTPTWPIALARSANPARCSRTCKPLAPRCRAARTATRSKSAPHRCGQHVLLRPRWPQAEPCLQHQDVPGCALGRSTHPAHTAIR